MTRQVIFFHDYFLLLLNDSVNLRPSSQLTDSLWMGSVLHLSGVRLFDGHQREKPLNKGDWARHSAAGWLCHPLLTGGLCGVLSVSLYFLPARTKLFIQLIHTDFSPSRFQFHIFWWELKPRVTVSNDSCLVLFPRQRLHLDLLDLMQSCVSFTLCWRCGETCLPSWRAEVCSRSWSASRRRWTDGRRESREQCFRFSCDCRGT